MARLISLVSGGHQIPTRVVENYRIDYWFSKCARRTPSGSVNFPGNPWIDFCNGYFEIYVFLNSSNFGF